MNHSLINPNQIRHAGIGYWDNLYDRDRGLKIEVSNSLTIPLYPRRTKLMFKTRVPTRHELDNCEHIDMSNPEPWDPRRVVLQPIDSVPPSNIKLECGSYAFLDPTDELSHGIQEELCCSQLIQYFPVISS